MAPPGDDERSALHPPTIKPAAWFEFVGDGELIAFKQPLLTALSRPVAIGEIVGGPRNGAFVLIPVRPAEDSAEYPGTTTFLTPVGAARPRARSGPSRTRR